MQPFLYQVAEDLEKRFGDKLSNIAVVFNNKRPAVFLKRYLSEIYKKAIVAPEILTIQEFMALSTDKAVAQDLSRFFLLFDCYNQLLREEGKPEDALETPEVFYPLSQTILSDFDQIDYEQIDYRSLYTHLKDLGELKQTFTDFTPEQQQFIESFWSSFSAAKQAAVQQKFIELWKRLPRLYERFHEKLSSQGLVDMAAVYRQLAEGRAAVPDFINRFDRVVFVGFNALNKCEAALFKKWQSEGKALFYFDGDAYYLEDEFQEAGLFLRKNLRDYGLENALGRFPDRLNREEKTLITYPVSGHIAQAKALNVHLQERLPESGDAPDKVAVILADEGLLPSTLQSIPDKSVINITMGFSIRQSPVFQLLKQWLSLQQQLQNSAMPYLSAQSLNDFLHIALLDFSEEEREEIMRQYEQLTPERFTSYLQGFNEAAQLFFHKQATGLQCVDTLKQLIQHVLRRKEQGGALYQLESSLMLSAFQELNQLGDQLARYRSDVTIPLVLTLTERCLAGLSAPLVGEPLEGIQIMGMLESRSLDFDEVYILGANDGTLPYNGVANTFIPDSLRRAFGLPLPEDRASLSAYLFYRLCQRASRIHVFYNALVDNNSTGEVSRFVQQLAFESKITISEYRQQPFSQGIPYQPQPLSITKTAAVMEKLNTYLDTHKGGDFSASMLKKYLDCPLQFFLSYIAGIKDPEETPEPYDPAVMGEVLHKVMQVFYEPFVGGGSVSKEEIKERRKELPDICSAAMRQTLPRENYQDGLPDSRRIIAEKIVLAHARLIVKHDMEQVAPFKVLALETDVSCVIPLDIYGDGRPRTVKFRGIIDRVDEVNGSVRIVDYKTGKDAVTIKGGMEDLFGHHSKEPNRAAFQILLYALLYYKKHGKVPQAHLYALRRMQDEGTGLHDDRGVITAETLATEAAMQEYETYLAQLIGELFDPGVPFRHNEHAEYCKYASLAVFCNSDRQEEPEEEQ